MFCEVIVVVVVVVVIVSVTKTPAKFDYGPVHITDLPQVDLSS